LIYSTVSIVALLFVLFYQFSNKQSLLFQNNELIKAIMIIIAFSGIFIMVVCFGKYFGFIMGFKMNIIDPKEYQLYISGLNNWVRHPLYAGTLIFIGALFVLFPFISNLICCTLITMYVFFGIKLEEKNSLLNTGMFIKIIL
jgi:protein-S-isoprenylcysteine O-methyltransferase Ste14